MIDNYDSFVYNLVRYMKELKEEIITFRNDKIDIEYIENLRPEGIIISPGPKSPNDSGISTQIISHFAGKIPILGICLGHQAIGHVFGANITKGNRPMHGKLSYITHDGKGIFNNINKNIHVTRYHSLVVDKQTLPECLEISAYSDEGEIMGIRHIKYAIEGVQFHPEAELTEYGHELLYNFIEICKKHR